MPDSEAPVSRSRALIVAAGIFSSRIVGLVREALVANFFGLGAHADVFQAAFRTPNLLVNLLGEGTISAAFIPVYSRMLEEGRQEEAGRFAGSIFGLLVVVVSALVLLGISLARPIVSILMVGWVNDAALVAAGELSINRFELTIQAVRLIFPMGGLLVLSAWALGILNSHRQFFLPYFAPVVWNIAIIGAFVVVGVLFMGPDGGAPFSVEALTRLLFACFTGGLIGGALQFLVQLPSVFRVLKGFRVSLSTRVKGVREAIVAFGPAIAGRGIAQVSGYVDIVLASLLAAGAIAVLRPALILYMLPVSLFGLSVAASELPELSRMGLAERQSFLQRLGQSIRQSMFFTIPTVVGYLAFGFLIVGALYRRGQFQLLENWLAYVVLAGYSLGLAATTLSRLLQNAFWALRDTKTPARMAGLRLVVSAAVAAPLMLLFDMWSVSETLQIPDGGGYLFFGAVGLAVGSSVAAWVELWFLSTLLFRRLEASYVPWGRLVRIGGFAVISAIPAAVFWWLFSAWPVLLLAGIVVFVYAATYLGAVWLLRWPELAFWAGRLQRRS